MSQYASSTVIDILNWIDKGKLVLPTIQRNFVWTKEQICDLFDSLASGYPIGTFLFWEVDKEKTRQIIFNEFVNCLDDQEPIQRGKPIKGKLPEYIAVLDGQQRITSLNIGINGYMNLRKKPRSPKFVKKYLALNVFNMVEHTSEEVTSHFMFDFVEKDEVNVLPIHDGVLCEDEKYWVLVSDIVGDDFSDIDIWENINNDIEKRGLPPLSASMQSNILKQIREVERSLKDVSSIYYYPSRTKDLREVVEIFVRVNNGGRKLSASDLMLSIAAAAIDDVDPQKQISDALELIRHAPSGEVEFPADKELVLRAGLMFTGQKSVSLKIQDNYSAEVITAIFKDNWDEIVASLQDGVKLLEWLGFNVSNIAKNLLLPVAYYLYRKKPKVSYLKSTSGEDAKDKALIKQWVVRAIIRSVFRDGTGSTLIYIRNVIDSSRSQHFPLGEFLSESSSKNLRIGEESIDDIMGLTYGNAAIRPILATLSKIRDVTSMSVDHMWPQALLSSYKRAKEHYPNISDTEFLDFKKRVHTISNLQLLAHADNLNKGDTPYDKWLEEAYDSDSIKAYKKDACVDVDAPVAFSCFLEFTDRRASIMRKRIKEEFPDDIEEKLFPNE